MIEENKYPGLIAYLKEKQEDKRVNEMKEEIKLMMYKCKENKPIHRGDGNR